jgi:hypothetical protein
LDAPQFGQAALSLTPHCAQNLRPSRLLLPHFEQRISSPDARRIAPDLSRNVG